MASSGSRPNYIVAKIVVWSYYNLQYIVVYFTCLLGKFSELESD